MHNKKKRLYKKPEVKVHGNLKSITKKGTSKSHDGTSRYS